MKKILGISLVALFAAVPMMAGAADLTEKTPSATDAQKVAAVSYVKGAYNAVASAVNTKQDQLKVGDADVSSAVSSEVRVDGQADNATLVTEKAVRDAIKAADTTAAAAISGLDDRLDAAEDSIDILTSEDSATEGSVAHAEASAAAAAAAASAAQQSADSALASFANYTTTTAMNTALNSKIDKTAIDTALDGDSTDTDVASARAAHTYANSAASAAETAAKEYAAGLASNYDAAGAAASAEAAAKAYADSKFLTLTTDWTNEGTSTVQLSNPSPAPAGSEVQG